MGYLTDLSINVIIKENRISEFKEEIKRQNNRNYNINDWFNYYDDISVNDSGEIEFADYYRKVYQGEEFAKWLAPFVEKGEINCNGEESGDVWRISFDGNGNYKIEEANFIWIEDMNTLSKIKGLHELFNESSNGNKTSMDDFLGWIEDKI